MMSIMIDDDNNDDETNCDLETREKMVYVAFSVK